MATDDKKTDKKKASLSVVVFGASGDLAKKKTFPALYSLWSQGLIPSNVIIYGFARTALSHDKFVGQIEPYLSKQPGDEKKKGFLKRLFYHSGQYKDVADFKALDKELLSKEAESRGEKSEEAGNRVFYFAIPPELFAEVGSGVKNGALSKTGWNRVIIEKPFGEDSETFAALDKEVSKLFSEEQVYRIDHYLGKEMVQNLTVLRFANGLFEPLWNRNYISMVLITFKEDFGTAGRGGYFDKIGIIRDVMQNHLLQILTLVAMETPVTLGADDVRNEKVKLLRAIPQIELEDTILGQYGPDEDKKNPGYLEDPGVPKDSNCPTFATAVVKINNYRWKGVPFILKAGKALNTRKCDVRIVFRPNPAGLFKDAHPNELVLRVQPSEAIYWKMMTKKPGLAGGVAHSELDLTYKGRYEGATQIPEAYERLIYDAIRGEQGLFVRGDELAEAWKIFTPLLHKIEKEKIKPIIYPFGSRGPKEADELTKKMGFVRNEHYEWPITKKSEKE